MSFTSIQRRWLPYGEAIYINNAKAPFCYEIDKENKAMYFQYNECTDVTVKVDDKDTF